MTGFIGIIIILSITWMEIVNRVLNTPKGSMALSLKSEHLKYCLKKLFLIKKCGLIN